MSLLDQAPLSSKREAISLPSELPLKKMIQRDITPRPKPAPSDTIPCVLGNAAACKLAIFGLPSFHTQTSRQKYVFTSHEIFMDTSTVQALDKASKTGPVLEVVSLIFMDKTLIKTGLWGNFLNGNVATEIQIFLFILLRINGWGGWERLRFNTLSLSGSQPSSSHIRGLWHRQGTDLESCLLQAQPES